MTSRELLRCLPEYRDVWVLVNPDQRVKDIIREVLDAHREFAGYYDMIAEHFEFEGTQEVCGEIYSFLKENIDYREEGDDDQTTALPAGILTRGHCDCKGYAGLPLEFWTR
jgi:hypothetical protein